MLHMSCMSWLGVDVDLEEELLCKVGQLNHSSEVQQGNHKLTILPAYRRLLLLHHHFEAMRNYTAACTSKRDRDLHCHLRFLFYHQRRTEQCFPQIYIPEHDSASSQNELLQHMCSCEILFSTNQASRSVHSML